MSKTRAKKVCNFMVLLNSSSSIPMIYHELIHDISQVHDQNNPICSMYGILTNICPKNHPNVGKYTIHGAYGNGFKEKNLF
jgi:hypothetical protein